MNSKILVQTKAVGSEENKLVRNRKSHRLLKKEHEGRS